ncbi:BtpA/SgcQ family protein [Draconibacterium sp. IB214405]|uniref:BtpA/SgcQ family protein n=1 Tax=Draconibacterium sp. IB214405 TaxID=3097352 RepID=UPI002A0EC13F|nr:BtpA/SgcQ family protein [Draconibacterium sp. IB214405]MDX8337988.1 BtpA/SgcQ family protein [Draconibacterium sp. IB214405]
MNSDKSIIGMVHVAALPGTPKNSKTIQEIIEAATNDARKLEQGGVDAIMIENMHDRPYLNREVGPEIVAAMTAIATKLRQEVSLPLGIQILAGANKQALAVAHAAGFDFIRAEGFVFGHLADEGMMNSDAAELLRYRKQIGADNIKLWTDIKKKHSSHSISSDVSIGEMAKAAEFFLTDGIIVTGNATGEEASLDDLEAVREVTNLPLMIGSGIDEENIAGFWPFADGFIVGSSFKIAGNWENEVETERVKSFIERVKHLRTDN